MANISSINGNPIVPSNGSVGTAQVASGYNLMTDDEKSKLRGVPAQGNTPFSSINGNPIVPSNGSVGTAQIADGSIGDDKLEQSGGILSLVDSLVEQVAAIQVQQGGGAPVDLVGYLKRADAEATYAHKSHKHAMADVTGLQAALDDAESSIAHLAGRLPIYYYTDVPSESSITEKPQLAVIRGGAVYLVE